MWRPCQTAQRLPKLVTRPRWMSSEPCATWWLFNTIASVHPMHPLWCTINCCSTTNRQRNAPLFTSLATDSVCASWMVGSTRGPDRTCEITGGPCAQTERSVIASTLYVLLPRSQGLCPLFLRRCRSSSRTYAKLSTGFRPCRPSAASTCMDSTAFAGVQPSRPHARVVVVVVAFPGLTKFRVSLESPVPTAETLTITQAQRLAPIL